ncbi:phosphodiester glycosidase family protein [Nostoc sp. CENA67]|uniref:Phosphodiester glycosidase family protein n=1 Tax=Amazonocrinis nigriterrae CENA67 TaxID=2794033 RepID=A0A8J7L527_9NOST|nr:phosphodiester glycosidase family protein [Amazonocrinis nigriterrae]MBH8560809.1 phosphodiester glycosidase family protein [Amazonocrinis nigriterrae CENA67]
MSIKKIVFLSVITICLLSGCKAIEANSAPKLSKSCPGEDPNFGIEFFKTNNLGNKSETGINHVIIFNPKSPSLDFKVNVGLSHKLYAKDARGNFRKEYVPKTFREIITDENSTLNGQRPLAAINADYIGTDDKPQGLNISRGVEYSGAFKNKRSSFGISGGQPRERKATIQTGRREMNLLNYNLVGGNGRFYRQANFKDICQALGEFACKQATNRSMVAITNKGYVILLVNDLKANSKIEVSPVNQELQPDMFDDVLKGIARNNCLGNIQEGMLFDGGMSPGLYYNQKIYVENFGPIGSAFLIYKK